MHLHQLLGTVAALLAATLIYAILKPLATSASRVPGPWYSIWTGAVLKYHWLAGRRPKYVQSLHERYGPVVRIAPNEVDFTDVDAVKAIYNSRETFPKSSFYRKFVAVRAPVIFTLADLPAHRRLRRLLSPPLSTSSLRQHHQALVQARAEFWIQRIKGEMATRGAVDLFKWNLFLATDVIGELSFGSSFQTLEGGEKNQYVHMVESIGPLGALRSAFPRLVSLASVLPPLLVPAFRSVAAASRAIRRYAEESLGRYYKLASSPSDGVLPPPTLFAKLYDSEQSGEITFDEICANAGGYILAGSDTTASTLTFLIWSVCRRPDIRDELVQQLQGLPGGWDDDHLRGMSLLNRIIDETLRMYPAVPSGLVRDTPAEGALLGGFQIDAGTVVCAQAYSMHRDAAVFADPATFDPGRWEQPSAAMLDAFMPFGRGPRACIGVHLARMELRLATAHFFHAFPNATVSAREGFSDEEMEQKMFFVANPAGGRCLVEV